LLFVKTTIYISSPEFDFSETAAQSARA